MIAALPYFVAGGLEVWYALAASPIVAVPLGWTGVATLWVALAYVAGRPEWLAKERAVGWWLLPFRWYAQGVAFTAQRLGLRERVEVVPGLWVGGWPRNGAPDLAQLDLTAELPRRGSSLRYACVPMLDGTLTDDERYHRAVEQAVTWRREGLPVLVHCAYGHGRSVAVVIGVLVREGLARDCREAHAMVLAVRPRARMTPGQRRMVERLVRGAG